MITYEYIRYTVDDYIKNVLKFLKNESTFTCSECTWFRRLKKEETVMKEYVIPQNGKHYPYADRITDEHVICSKGVLTCQHPNCWVIDKIIIDPDPIKGDHTRYMITRIAGHVDWNYDFNCPNYSKTIIPIKLRRLLTKNNLGPIRKYREMEEYEKCVHIFGDILSNDAGLDI